MKDRVTMLQEEAQPRRGAMWSGSTTNVTSRMQSTRTAQRGTLTIIGGCMFSGKTTELLNRWDEAGASRALAFKHIVDDRYSAEAIVSHGGKAMPAVPVDSARAILARASQDLQLVAIDELHFFDDELVDVLEALVLGGIDVIGASLDWDSWGRPFALYARMRTIADLSIHKHAVCVRCGGAADRTQRRTPIVNGRMVGGPESYQPRCSRCWKPPPMT